MGLQMVENKLFCGDCLEIMPQIPDQSIDCIICDPPYGTTACKWDSIIPLKPLWEQYWRIMKPLGAVLLFGSQPFSSALIMSCPQYFKYEWIWIKGRATGFVHAKNKPMKAHENVLVFSRGTTVHESQSDCRMNYYPQKESGFQGYTRVRRTTNTGRLNHEASKSNLGFVGTVSENGGDRYPISTLNFGMHNVGNIHPTQKPVALIEYLIRTYTKPGDVVLDNCMGSGTTIIAALNAGRSYIGIEKDPSFYEAASRRIEDRLNTLI